MRNKVKDKLVGIYAPGNYDHTSVLGQTQEFLRWFWENRKDMDLISAKLGINTKKLNRILTLEQLELEANGFGWVFNCQGVEVKEVTDE